jgi:hypothetical protein
MAIGAEETKVGESIVVPSAIHMIEFEGNGLIVPTSSVAHLTDRFHKSFSQEPLLEAAARQDQASNHKELMDRASRDDWCVVPPPPGLSYEMSRVQT